jgi:hypothetical protein
MAARRLVNLLQRSQPPRNAVRAWRRDGCLGPDWGDPVPHARQDGQAFSVIRHSRRLVLKKPVPSLL